MRERIEAIDWNSPQLKELLLKHYELAAPKAEEARASQQFKAIISHYAAIFPEDRHNIGSLFEWEMVDKATTGKVVMRKDVFAGATTSSQPDCPTCPDDLIKEYPSSPGIRSKKTAEEPQQAAEEAFSLPEEFYEPDEVKQPITDLAQARTVQDLEEFFQVGKRPFQEVHNEILSYYQANGIDNNGRLKKPESILQEFLEKAVLG